jgi:hypothetical protein
VLYFGGFWQLGGQPNSSSRCSVHLLLLNLRRLELTLIGALLEVVELACTVSMNHIPRVVVQVHKKHVCHLNHLTQLYDVSSVMRIDLVFWYCPGVDCVFQDTAW